MRKSGIEKSTSESYAPIRLVRTKHYFWRRLRCGWNRFWDGLRSQFSTDPLDRCRWMRFGSGFSITSHKPKDQLALAGEEEAGLFLNEKGYSLLRRNLRFPEGEIDFIVRDEKTLVFVEVKTRRINEFGEPFEAVRSAKRGRLVAMADKFVAYCGLNGVPIRFDVVSITWPMVGPPRINHIKGAFQGK